MNKFLFSLILGLGWLNLSAQPGTLQSSFGDNGVVRTNFGNLTGLPVITHLSNSLLPAPGGGFYTSSEIGGIAYITRWNSNGTVDPSYGSNGYSRGARIFFPSAVIQPDEKIVVTGFNGSNYAAARYNPDGSFDQSFGAGGKVLVPMGPGTTWAYTNAMQPDGKIIIGGISTGFSQVTFIRLLSNGELDAGFGIEGKVVVQVNNQWSNIRGIAVQPDGKIIAAGSTFVPGGQDGLVVRLNSDGSLDNGFNGTGILFVDVQNLDGLYAISVQDDGKIVAAGETEDPVDYSLIIRINPDGSFDNSFNGNGKVLVPFGGLDSWLINIRVQPDGRIVAAGGVQVAPSNQDLIFVRVHPDGSLDPSFNSSGIQIINSPNLEFQNNAQSGMIIQGDGKLAILGVERFTASSLNTQIILRRLNVDGSADNSFGVNGKASVYVNQNTTQFNDVILQPDGKIIGVGNWLATSNPSLPTGSFALARFNPDGSPDHSFNGDGKNYLSLGQGISMSGTSAALQDDGKILVGGFSQSPPATPKFTIARFNSNGSVDNSFGTNGIVFIDFGASSVALNKLLIQPDGKIVAVGTANIAPNGNDFALARLNADGTADNSFGLSGKVTTSVSPANGNDQAMAAALQADGKIVVAGSTPNSGTKAVVVRYNSNGTLDNSFNGTGRVMLNLGTTNEAIGTGSLVIQPDGKILVGANNIGQVLPNVNQLALVRFNPDGSFDNSFNGNGKLFYSFNPGQPTLAQAVATHISTVIGLQWDGRIIAASRVADIFAKPDLAVARFLPDGTPDQTFNQTGNLIIDAADGGITQKNMLVGEMEVYIAGFGNHPGGSGVIAAINLGESVFCSYGQGFFGNKGGTVCNGVSVSGTADMLNTAIGSGFVIGRSGRSITVNPGSAASLMAVLPGGGPSKALPPGDVTLGTTMSGNNYLKNGRINNAFLAHTLTLILNARISGGTLMNIPVQTGVLVTQQTSGCGYSADVVKCGGSQNALHAIMMNAPVATYLAGTGTATVAGLLELAHDVLGGVKIPGQNGVPAFGDISAAIEIINIAFGGCRAFVGYDEPSCQGTQFNVLRQIPQEEIMAAAIGERFTVFPNPSSGVINLQLPAAALTKTVTVTDMMGRLILSQRVEKGAMQLDLRRYGSGVYLVQIDTGEEILRSRVVIQ